MTRVFSWDTEREAFKQDRAARMALANEGIERQGK